MAMHENIDPVDERREAPWQCLASKKALEGAHGGNEPARTESIERTQRGGSPVDEILQRKEAAPHAIVTLPERLRR